MCSINRVMLTFCWFLCLESVCHLCFLVLLYEPPCVCIIDVSVCWYLWTYVCICVCCQHSADNEPQRTAGKSKRSASSLEPKLTKKRKMDTAPNPLDATWIHPESYDLADKWVHCICELVLGVVLGRGSTHPCPHMSVCWRLLWVYHVHYNMQ